MKRFSGYSFVAPSFETLRLPKPAERLLLRGWLLGMLLVITVGARNISLAQSQASTNTVMTVTSGGSPVTTVTSGSVITLTATVTSETTPVTAGQVDFCDASAAYCEDIHIVGVAQLTSTGTAVFKFRPGTGSHSYKAIFPGTTGNTASVSGSAALAVTGPSPTTTTLAESGAVGDYTLTATVGGAAASAPSGVVSFVDGNTLLGSAALGAGTAQLNFFPTEGISEGNDGYQGSSQPYYAAVTGDFNNDGIADLAVLESMAPGTDLGILLGIGNGTFVGPIYTQVETSQDTISSIAVGDFNRDGILDIAVSDKSSNNVTIYLGKGDGTFTALPAVATGNEPESMAVADFNGDGILDIAVANVGDNDVSILLGNGDGTFTATLASPEATGAWSIATGDFNGDGIPDLAVTNFSGNAVTILLGNGDGTFKSASASPATGDAPGSIVVADFNGDGIPDLAVANENSNTLTVLLGNGDGTFTATSASPATGDEPLKIAIGDFNGDGIPDLAVMNGINTASVTILLGNGNGTFTSSVAGQVPALGTDIASADFNGDGLSDLVSVTGGITFLMAATQTATASDSGIAAPPATGINYVDASYAGDVENAASISSQVSLTAAQGTPSVSVAASPNPASVGATVTLTATVTGSGLAPTGTVAFFDSNGQLGTGTLNSSGVATFATSAFPSGSYSVTATYEGDSHYTAFTSPAITLTVKMAPTITWPAPAAITYGTSLSGTQLNATANVAGTFVYSPASGTVLGAGPQTLETTFTPTDTTDYAVATDTVTLTVNQATPTIAWATPAAIVYGTALSATQLDATASVPGTFVYNPVLGVTPPVGNDTLSVTFTPKDNVDYATATATVTLTVNPAPNPVPFLGNMTPAIADAGGSTFTITVNGSGFLASSTVYWGATALMTQFVSSTQLTATVTAADIATPGATAVNVQTPAPGGGTSDVLQFEVDSPSGSETAPSVPSTVVTVTAGSSATYPISFPAAVTSATATCLNLPTGALCSYSSLSKLLTISTSSTTPVGTYQVTVVFSETVTSTASAGILLPFLLLPLFFLRRKLTSRGMWSAVCLGLILLATTAFSVGCGGPRSSTTTTTTQSVTSSAVVGLAVQ